MKSIFTLKRYLIIQLLIVLSAACYTQNYNTIEFIENKGQWNPQVKFKGDVSAGAFFIRKNGFTVLQNNRDDVNRIFTFLHQPLSRDVAGENEKHLLRSHSYNVDFIGASTDLEIMPDKPLPTYNNYFIGNDPSKWAGNCRIYQGITVKNIYPNVDIRYFTDNGTLKYDIIAHPGADINQIAMKYEGVDKLSIKNKELVIGTSVGDLTESTPFTYQAAVKGRNEINCKYEIKNNIVRFRVKDYDPSSTLIIDPSLIFCSFSGSTVDNWGYTATYGPDGSMYGGGIVFGNGFPVSPGAFQTTFQGGGGAGYAVDIGIIKLTPNGTNRVYATYIGGSGNEQPHSLIVDPQGNLIMAGRSDSPNYPTFGPIGSSYSGSGTDIVITKLNAAGNALIGSVKIGGSGEDGVNISTNRSGSVSLDQNYGDDGRSEVQLDGAGNIYLASSSQSTNFPMVNAFQASNNGGGNGQDGVVLKFTSNLSALLFSTYIGGKGNDAAYVVDLAPNGNIYVAGGTESTDFPGVPASGVISSINSGVADGFVSILSSNGVLLKSTYVGTNGIDQVYGIKFDKNGFPYIMGQTTGNWPVINAPYSNAGAKQFIAKLQPDLSGYLYSTVFGSASPYPNISPVAFLVDRCENVYVSGWGGKSSFTSNYLAAGTDNSMPITPDAFKSITDGKDFYFFVLKKDAAGVLFGSFYGENNGNQVGAGGTDHVDGGTSRFDKNGVIYQAICGNCKEFNPVPPYPTTPGAWATTNPSPGCNLTMLKIAFNFSGVRAGIESIINGVPRDSSGCVPLTVNFADTIAIAQSYEWYFGDGSPMVTTTIPNTSHTYNSIGTYLAMLVAVDPATCNVRDTSYIHIRVGDVQATLNFNTIKLNPCDSFKYRFDNLSSAPLLPFTPQSFVWDFGDGSPRISAGTNSVFHNYTSPGTFNVRMILVDTNYCNAPDSFAVQLRVAALVKAQFETPPTGCTPYLATFNNTSLAGQTFIWDFGDGSPLSNDISPTHLYTTAGTYTITLIANDPNTCNLTDTTRYSITVFNNPVSNFTASPVPPVENTPTTFDNLSSPDAISFKWLFGDGDTLVTSSRSPVQHQYNATGTFNACLIAYNAAGCADTSCQQVQAIIVTLVDVPNAFTPQSGDINSKIMVRGFGIAKMHFIIWNRWGQKVFESENKSQAWDGKYKGVLQPMDVYAYTLDVVFFDGTKTTRKGDITLIR
ncbi:MAG: PKD domain-containing protein [Bacteroidetes bacterium]|nr:PKD domain-containing protein [Bacteroidota bacterium]MBS1932323.1 PKD domain-containing protein [Bacteroidota bacterium]